GDMNFFIFMSEAVLRIIDFKAIHSGQRKKECWAWTEIISVAKRNKEIKSALPDEDIAMLFLDLCDGIMMNSVFSQKEETGVMKELKRALDNLYDLLVNKK
ncbi:MAG: hypothetical protein LBR26_06395, partial [Prevotella sp.]|nr:hypothetical protein [Prevotella sp.]